MKAIMVKIGCRNDQWKRWLVGLYFCVSFFALCIGDESPVWVIALVVANFANAVRLVRKIDWREGEEFNEINELNV